MPQVYRGLTSNKLASQWSHQSAIIAYSKTLCFSRARPALDSHDVVEPQPYM